MFPHRIAGHCGSGALRDLLEFHGLDFGEGPLSEGAVFGLAGGLGFFYVENSAFTPPFYLVGRTADLERDIVGNLGLDLEVRETDDAAEGWSWVLAELEAGRPTMVWADIAELEYLRVRMSNTRHDIVVVGHDPEAGIAWIADNDREELQPCSMKSLEAARMSNGFPGPNRNATYLYSWPERLIEPQEAVRRGLARAVANMRQESPGLGELRGGIGLAAVDALAAGYPAWPETFEDDLEKALSGLWVFIVKAGTGGAMFRSLHARFLRDAAGWLSEGRLEALADHYDELSAVWIELADTAKRGDHGAGVGLVEAVRSMEHRGVELMEEMS
ncbi:MAG: BtrH N-terminal domain-containing protein [Solirubrobacterales bacterium]